MPAVIIDETTGINSTLTRAVTKASTLSTLTQLSAEELFSSSTSSSSSSSSSSASASSLYRYLPDLPIFSPPSVENLLAIGPQQQHTNPNNQNINSNYDDFRTAADSLEFFQSENFDDELFGSPLAFDASENGLWNGRFVPPPPRPPFMDDILTDGVTTCDLCSWAMPTKSTFIFEGTIEKASELGWPLTLIIVSIISAILGAIIMVTVVKCRRKKSTNRNETHVQWWSRNKRPTSNNLRRSNIYTAHPAGDSIRGLHPNNNTNTISAASSAASAESCSWPNVTTIVVSS